MPTLRPLRFAAVLGVAALLFAAEPSPARSQVRELDIAITECEAGDRTSCMELYRGAAAACERGSERACDLAVRLVEDGHVQTAPRRRDRWEEDERGGRRDRRGGYEDPRGGYGGSADACRDPQLRRALIERGYCR
jgi:hypothetical protein